MDVKARRGLFAGAAALCAAGMVLTGCFSGTGRPPVDIGEVLTPVDPVETRSVFSMPRLAVPGFGGFSGGGTFAGMPADEVQCRAELRRMGVTFTDIAPIRDSAVCFINHPVEVSGLARGVALKPAAKLNCQAALALAQWLQDDAGPAARARYLTGIAEVQNMSSYSCRRINGTATWSEHSIGNAIDIGGFKLKNGHEIDVRKPGLFAMRERSFLKTIRASACNDFNTVLGPGYNSDHADHFHLDLRARKSGRTYCR